MTRTEAAKVARAAKALRTPSLQERFWSKVSIRGDDECWPWMAGRRRLCMGYGAFWSDGRHVQATHMAVILSGGSVPNGLMVLHKCDNPACCNPRHLRVGTHAENMNDKVERGRQAKGERSPKAKLTEEQVAFIRSHKESGVKRLQVGVAAQLAERFGVSKRYISELFKRGWGAVQ